MTKRFTLIWKSAAVLAGICLLVALGYAGFLYHINNYHAVLAGEMYRSAQVSGADLEAYQKNDGIRSIINLRGAAPKARWYRDEVAAAGRLGIRHMDFKMSSGEGLDALEAQKLVALMQAAPKPLLIHCHSGSNRTGLAAALYLIVVKGATLEETQKQLSLKYGHFSLGLSPAYAMDDTLWRFSHAHKAGLKQATLAKADVR